MTEPVPVIDIVNGKPDFDTAYTRCPVCSVVGACGSVEYALTSTWDWDQQQPVVIKCVMAAHTYSAYAEAFLLRDAVRVCSRPTCRATFAVPAIADQVICPQCRLYQPGPFIAVDDDRVTYVDGVQAEYDATVRARLNRRRGPGSGAANR